MKRSNQAARAALHELTKYVALLKSTLGVQLERIRVLLISTDWHELAVPFSEYLRTVEVPTEGLVIQAEPNGEVTSVKKFTPVTLERPLSLERMQQIYLYENAEKRDQALAQIANAARQASIVDFIILKVDYEGDKVQVINPHGAYFLFSAPVDYNDKASLDNFIARTGINWEELDSPSENFLCWMQEFEEVDYDSFEIGYPEKLSSICSTGWRPKLTYRAGRYETNSELMPDESLRKVCKTPFVSPAQPDVERKVRLIPAQSAA
ncbi:hypothetical protein M5C98_07590 [Acidovorax sp. NCPPB 3576]|nr:hypothetical protein M5C98_07590 [Acidovorax sp. NCPPB 3576]